MKRFKKKYLPAEIRKRSLFHMILPTVVILVCFFILYKVDFNHIFHPEPYTNSFDAYNAYSQGEDEFVVKISSLKYTGYNIVKNEKISQAYYYDLYGGKCMFYKLDISVDSPTDIPQVLVDKILTVKVSETDGLYQNMLESFASGINWNASGLSNITFPVIMEESKNSTNIFYLIYAAIIIAIFYSAYIMAQNILVSICPYLHPAYLKLKPYYKDISYFEMIDNINDNFDNNVIIQAEEMYITDKYFINMGNHEVSIIPLDQIVFAYNHSQLHTFFGIHLHMHHTLHFRGYKNIRICASHKKAPDTTVITDYLRENYPGIIWGYTKENLKAYRQLLSTERANRRK